jgi:hypothetical protein
MAEVLFDSSRLWKRVGLHELRGQLEHVASAAKRFEQALKELPSCDECAKLALLDYIQSTGRKLGTQVASLSVLAESLKSTVDAVQGYQIELTANPPRPCQCKSDRCSCHN